jgi:hypothetical protein
MHSQPDVCHVKVREKDWVCNSQPVSGDLIHELVKVLIH